MLDGIQILDRLRLGTVSPIALFTITGRLRISGFTATVDDDSIEANELDTYDEGVLQVYDDIKRILRKYNASRPENQTRQPPPVQTAEVDDNRQLLNCARILRVSVEQKLVTITVAKLNGEIVILRIQAAED